MRNLLHVFLLSLLVLAGCGGDESARLDEFRTRPVTLPDGTVVHVEVVTQKVDMARGMMFRDSLPEGRGMLFIHGQPGKNSYWMYQVKIPLDIIWMDRNGNVVEMVESAPPCLTKSSQCPTFGGTQEAMVVLELPGGYGRKHGVRVGQNIRF